MTYPSSGVDGHVHLGECPVLLVSEVEGDGSTDMVLFLLAAKAFEEKVVSVSDLAERLAEVGEAEATLTDSGED